MLENWSNVIRALVVYESMYGNTHLVADAIAAGLAAGGIDVSTLPVARATADAVHHVDLLVVGGPTHAHSLSRESTRKAAVSDADKPDSGLHLDPTTEGEGLREWFDTLSASTRLAAAFDTRFHMSAAITGRASKGIGKRLRRHGYTEVIDPESFFVKKGNTLETGEERRAREWGGRLAQLVADHAVI